ncbi:hypothetical protein C7441_101489 [Pseudaminobacter salicylatoxidans]|uniref:Uncharacterized protein n=1 Tax=Pseudaminobacter salicylatoxidans TaxID=93369 RepID=A0A316CAT7_PSESE|nr:hypothetical protein [Pseudaminobacter salicylatoxidans]PWJ86608.1 hypothetical protein C7441_101489 [Pseudaminobacter salicylatoxidans]
MIEIIRKRPLLALVIVAVVAALVTASVTIGVIQTATFVAMGATAAVMGAIVIGSVAR